MNFQPVVPLSGYVGWRFLERTVETQQEAFNESQPVQRATDYFAENIGKIRTAEDLVNDRQLLSVALGAFGLDEDINNKFFIQKILEGGTTDDEALANRLSDNRYADFSEAFGFGELAIPGNLLPGFSEDIINRYETKQFERAVGDQNNDLRLAMSLDSGIADVINRTDNANAQWFSIMGNAPLRTVFQTALGLPISIASIDLDTQLEIYQDRARSVFGTDDLADFTDPDKQEELIRIFLIRSEAANFNAASSGSTALTLLQSVRPLF